MIELWRKSAGIGRCVAMLLMSSFCQPVHAISVLGDDTYSGTINIRIRGTLLMQPCTLPAERIDVDLGSINSTYLYNNSRSASQAFSLPLLQCDTRVAKTVTVTFSGTESTTLPGMLAVDETSVPTGIVVGLETRSGEALPLNQTTETYALVDGDNNLVFGAYVQGESEAIKNRDISTGGFSATAIVVFNYE